MTLPYALRRCAGQYCSRQKEIDLHSMHEGVFGRLAKIEIIELGNDVIVQDTSLEKVD